jgi:hypothetical protein
MGKRLISFSLYGRRPMYLRGMMANARLAPIIYPGWQVRVYCEDDTPDRAKLAALGCDVKPMGHSVGSSGMLWRFLAAWDRDAERVIFRDADSRLNVREAAAVAEWIDSGLAAHSMLDHPHHARHPLMGGLWGIVGGVLPQSIAARMFTASTSPCSYGEDMAALARDVFPLIRESLLVHSSVKALAPFASPPRPFPAHPPFDGFVGQQIGDDGRALWAGETPATRTGGELCLSR